MSTCTNEPKEKHILLITTILLPLELAEELVNKLMICFGHNRVTFKIAYVGKFNKHGVLDACNAQYSISTNHEKDYPKFVDFTIGFLYGKGIEY